MTMNSRLTKAAAVLILLSFFGITGAHADVPRLISFQGNLTDNSGNRLTGTYDFTFRLYDAENAGTMEWQETQSGIAVTNGLYLVQLGANNPLDLPFNEDYWLEIYVKPSVSVNYEKLSPRQHLTSTPYSYRSEYANSASSITGNTFWLSLTTGGVTSLHTHATGAPTAHVNSHLVYGNDPLPAGFISDYYIANSTITAAKIQDNAVTSAKILDGAVTPTKVSTAAYENIRVGTATVAYGLGRNSYNLATSTFTFYSITVSSRIIPVNDLSIGSSGRKVSFPGNVDVDGRLTYVSTQCISLGGYISQINPLATNTYDSGSPSHGLGFTWVDFGNLNVARIVLDIYYYKPALQPNYTWQLYDETTTGDGNMGEVIDTLGAGYHLATLTITTGIPNDPRRLRVRFMSDRTTNGPDYYGSCLRIFTQ